MVEALRALGEQFRIDMPVHMNFTEVGLALPQAQSLALYRIAQESLNNARKYSKATLVNLNLFVEDGSVVLRIQDNGVGFEQDGTQAQGHGIVGMKHRTQMFNGRLVLSSAPGKGTLVEVRMPLGSA